MIAGRIPEVFAQFAGIAAGSRSAAGLVAHAAAETTPAVQRSGLLGVATTLEGLTGQARSGTDLLDDLTRGQGADELVRHAFGAAAVARLGTSGLEGVAKLLRDAAGSASTEAVAASVTDDAMGRLQMIGQTFDFVARG